MIIYIKLNAKSKLNPREFPINFEFYINPPYPKEQPIVLCKSHFCFPSLFDNRNFSNALINKWSSFNHIDLLITMIHNIPYLITKYENDIENGLFYYDGEYSYSFLYKTSILYRIVINVLFCIDVGLIYFLLLKVINYGVVHIYFVMVFLISFILFSGKYKNLRKCVKLKKSKVKSMDKKC